MKRKLRPSPFCLGFGLILACSACDDDDDDGAGSTLGDSSAIQSLPNGALHFNGSSDFGITGTAGFPTGLNPQTISLWVKYASSSGIQVFVTLRKDFASGVNVGIRGGQVAVWAIYDNAPIVATTKLPSVGVWHNIAFVLDPIPSGYLDTLYVDGVAAGTSHAAPDRLTPLLGWLGSPDGTSEFFAGEMDEIRIWNIARSNADVLADMKGDTASDAPGLVAYYNCDSILGDRLPDVSGHGNDATLEGGDPNRIPTLVASTAP